MFEVASQLAQVTSIDASLDGFGVTGIDVAGTEGDSHQPFTVFLEMLVEIHREALRVDDPTHLEVVVGEHDAQVARAPFDVAAARRYREAEAFELRARVVKVSRGDDRMIDIVDAQLRVLPRSCHYLIPKPWLTVAPRRR